MKFFVFTFMTIFCLLPATIKAQNAPNTPNDSIISNIFEQWKTKYVKGKTANIVNSSNSNAAFERLKKLLMSISKQNIRNGAKKSLFKMALNIRATDDETTRRKWNGLISTSYGLIDQVQTKALPMSFPPAPKSWDWRQQGLVTNVEDQGYYCGSCYAFASSCALEGQVAKKYGILKSLSKQQIVDCSKPYGNFGCDGGYIDKSFNYTYRNPGLFAEADYPYAGIDQNCNLTSNFSKSFLVNYNFIQGDEENLKRALYAIGPLSVGMIGSFESFYFYSEGIYDDATCTGKIDHAVCLVGYGTDNTTSPPTDYWIVKNSWSSDWGENGYFRILRGSNMCNISTYVAYPII
ncbi:hypothetical protein PVAND_016530 [Polypedilum vanderplanki]|uniref:Peptidase C1A papain C-terminal domain-containing protein n=1 Tax=Polypedilum vanderplanki TaxID=319348 RepID=A0A9J6BFV4_POLVA|nr:hypothetical protein PVAND_016530 [Polypedilum vanderplanki]